MGFGVSWDHRFLYFPDGILLPGLIDIDKHLARSKSGMSCRSR
jgi:hypothetical protein